MSLRLRSELRGYLFQDCLIDTELYIYSLSLTPSRWKSDIMPVDQSTPCLDSKLNVSQGTQYAVSNNGNHEGR